MSPGNLSPNTLVRINPVNAVFLRLQNGQISQEQADREIARLSQFDVRDEISRLLLRPQTWNQQNLSIRGGAEHHNYSASITYNGNQEEFIKVKSDQIVANVANGFDLTPKLSANTSINFSYTKEHLSFVDPKAFPFDSDNSIQNLLSVIPLSDRILDDNGNYVPMVSGANPNASQDALALGYPYPWTFNLKQEFDNLNSHSNETDLRIQAALRYQLFPWLRLSSSYQYEWSAEDERTLSNENSYLVRNRINTFAQTDSDGNVTSLPIPRGSIADLVTGKFRTHTFRSQLDFNGIYGSDDQHQIDAILGYEARKLIFESQSNRLYGFNDETLVNINPDYQTLFSSPFLGFGAERIPAPDFPVTYSEDRFLSYYANVAYSYLDRYVITGSTRLDDTNLFGASKKYRNVPLYSVGLKWDISGEPFFWKPRKHATAQGNLWGQR